LAALVNAIANIKTNISDTRTTIYDNASARIDITVDITDIAHLDRVIAALKGVAGVITVERTS
jgi:(p)ppGpp synthase/HD superfamily hydrolase